MVDNNNSPEDWGKVESTDYGHPTALPINKQNKVIYVIVAVTLAVTVVLFMIGGIILAFYGKETPNAIVAIASISATALAGLFKYRG